MAEDRWMCPIAFRFLENLSHKVKMNRMILTVLISDPIEEMMFQVKYASG